MVRRILHFALNLSLLVIKCGLEEQKALQEQDVARRRSILTARVSRLRPQVHKREWRSRFVAQMRQHLVLLRYSHESIAGSELGISHTHSVASDKSLPGARRATGTAHVASTAARRSLTPRLRSLHPLTTTLRMLLNSENQLLDRVLQERLILTSLRFTLLDPRINTEQSRLVHFLRLNQRVDPALLAILQRLNQLLLLHQMFLIFGEIVCAHIFNFVHFFIVSILQGLPMRTGIISNTQHVCFK